MAVVRNGHAHFRLICCCRSATLSPSLIRSKLLPWLPIMLRLFFMHALSKHAGMEPRPGQCVLNRTPGDFHLPSWPCDCGRRWYLQVH